MSQAQKGILWIGILVVLVFLFTDQSFRNQLFGRSTSTTTSGTTTDAAVSGGTAPPNTSQSGSAGSIPYSATTILDTLTGVPASSTNTATTPSGASTVHVA